MHKIKQWDNKEYQLDKKKTYQHINKTNLQTINLYAS